MKTLYFNILTNENTVIICINELGQCESSETTEFINPNWRISTRKNFLADFTQNYTRINNAYSTGISCPRNNTVFQYINQ